MFEKAELAAEAFCAAIRSRDVDQLAAIYADDVAIWQCATDTTIGKAENLAAFTKVFGIVSRLDYENVRRHPIEGGLVQQHRVICIFEDGGRLPPLDACLVIEVREGLISKIEEYFDSRAFAPMVERLADLH